MSRICPQCQTPSFRKGAKKCDNCGSKLSSAAKLPIDTQTMNPEDILTQLIQDNPDVLKKVSRFGVSLQQAMPMHHLARNLILTAHSSGIIWRIPNSGLSPQMCHKLACDLVFRHGLMLSCAYYSLLCWSLALGCNCREALAKYGPLAKLLPDKLYPDNNPSFLLLKVRALELELAQQQAKNSAEPNVEQSSQTRAQAPDKLPQAVGAEPPYTQEHHTEPAPLQLPARSLVEAANALTIALTPKVELLEDEEDEKENVVSLGELASMAPYVLSWASPHYLKWGHYPQQKPATPETPPFTPIHWMVLEANHGQALLISRFGLDYRTFHQEADSISWGNSNLRHWLNHDFFLRAFTPQEQQKIILTTIHTPDHPKFGTSGGMDAQDHLFLLSYEEVEDYFLDREQRVVSPTPYAISLGAQPDPDRGEYWSGKSAWWLRSPGCDQQRIMRISFDGSFNSYFPAWSSSLIRPAMLIKYNQDS